MARPTVCSRAIQRCTGVTSNPRDINSHTVLHNKTFNTIYIENINPR